MAESRIRLEIIATNGKKMVTSAWCVSRRGKGIQGGICHSEVGLHFSYHEDGTVHTKIEDPEVRHLILSGSWNEGGYAPRGLKGPPLSEFKGAYGFVTAGVTLDSKYFEDTEPYNMRRADRLILVDSRSVTSEQKMILYYFELVEPSNYTLLGKRLRKMQEFICADGQSVCEHHCFLEQRPWLLVHLAYCSKHSSIVARFFTVLSA